LESRAGAGPHVTAAAWAFVSGRFGNVDVGADVRDRLLALDPFDADERLLTLNAFAVARNVSPDDETWKSWSERTLAALRSRSDADSLACAPRNAASGRSQILYALAYEVCQRYVNVLGRYAR
jgi:hypothetical protein